MYLLSISTPIQRRLALYIHTQWASNEGVLLTLTCNKENHLACSSQVIEASKHGHLTPWMPFLSKLVAIENSVLMAKRMILEHCGY